eukprot:GFKZ01005259.1.p1 GENE.GFKZ01005259.1~~GFKZ01005259.1.p1  ORF type:complete len:1256 (-),score=175.61 GFKZ01005259.1:205-3972(-)
MQNPFIYSVSHFFLPCLPYPLPRPTSYLPLPHITSSSLSVTLQPLPPNQSQPALSVTVPTHFFPPRLPHLCFAAPKLLLLGTPHGELFSIDFSVANPDPVLVANVMTSDEHNTKIIAIASSPDCSRYLVVSPVNLILLDPNFDLVLQRSHTSAKHAIVSWSADSTSVVVIMIHQDASVSGVVLDVYTKSAVNMDSSIRLALDPVVAWDPRPGGFIVVTVNGRAMFFERNGLRHLRSDFRLGGDSIHALAWSFDSRWLAVAGHWGQHYELRLFATRNYKWYCGKRIRVTARVSAVIWGEDNLAEMSIYLVDGNVMTLNILPRVDLLKVGQRNLACVVDGDKLLLTDFEMGTPPPPLYHAKWSFSTGIQAVCDGGTDGHVGILLDDGSFETRTVKQGDFEGAQMEDDIDGLKAKGQRWVLERENEDRPFAIWRSPVVLKKFLLVLADHASKTLQTDHEAIKIFQLGTGPDKGKCTTTHFVAGQVTAIYPSAIENSIIVTTSTGVLAQLLLDPDSGEVSEGLSLAAVVSKDIIRISDHEVDGAIVTLALDKEGVLKMVQLSTGRALWVSQECTSYCVHGRFLSFTTSSHLLHCMFMGTAAEKSYVCGKSGTPCLLDALRGKGDAVEETPQGLSLREGKGAIHPIDRGSLLIAGLLNGWDIVLQAPRGNLETICPRPAAFEAIDMFAKCSNYRDALQLCSRQQVNTNQIVDADFDLFIGNIKKFVVEAGHQHERNLSIFMTSLNGNENKINTVCDEIVRVLRQMEHRERYTNAILTGLTRREPMDIEQALNEIKFLRNQGMKAAGKSALDYLFILVKVQNKVYEEALGMYDIDMASFVAQNSVLDPADYGSELHQLSLMSEKMKKYSIDMRLRRYDKGLRHLHSMGPLYDEDCVALCKQHGLYETALELFQNNKDIKFRLLHGFGVHLSSKNRHEEAAGMFMRIGDLVKAYDSYHEAELWTMCATTICRRQITWSKKCLELESLADELHELRKFVECAEIRMYYLGDVRGALGSVAAMEDWELMFKMAAAYCGQVERGLGQENTISSADVWKAVDRLVLAGALDLIGTISGITEQIREWRERLEVVRERKRELGERLIAKGGVGTDGDSDMFTATTGSSVASGLSDVNFRNRSSATSLYSSAASQAGPLSEGKLRKQEEKRKRKAAKKRVKQGSPREEGHLIEQLKRIVPGRELKVKVVGTLRALIFLGSPDLACKLERKMSMLIDEIKLVPTDVVEGTVAEELEDFSSAEGGRYLGVM